MANGSEPFRALVIGASGGLGAAIALELERNKNCIDLRRLSRRDDGLDLSQEHSVKRAAEMFAADNIQFDIIFNASGILVAGGDAPEKAFREIDASHLQHAFAVNSIGAALAFKYFMPLLKRRERTVFATLSARIGSIGDNRLGGWMSYRASKAALNQIVRCAAIEEARRNQRSIIVALHPGTVKTPLTEKFAGGRYTATPQEAAENLLRVIAGLQPNQSGGFFDYAGRRIEW
ncbi:SDR family NAD(P)-dependent oxidoreductase [Hyphococcus sp.]|uniref:SDR family NAD(P)-dependent oxidoreductase n=1 Tax=Hyphococcus sp. TaxID=2038636 RepID=UPI003CCBE98A